MTGAGRLTLGRWVGDRARATPERVAVVSGDRRVTYAGLEAGARELAGAFRHRGLARGDRVATLTTNSIEHVTCLFACAKAALVLVPLNWRLARPRPSWPTSSTTPSPPC
ncbi:MAG: AMP-binding protein [Acidimicrobiales bacterium]